MIDSNTRRNAGVPRHAALTAISLALLLAAVACANDAARGSTDPESEAQVPTLPQAAAGSYSQTFLATSASGAPLVRTPNGAFPAATYQGTSDGDVSMFRGIRFAAAPTGDRRWSPPIAPSATTDTVDASQFGSACPQLASPFGVASSDEDCLFLNVFVPTAAARPNSLPVMVYFYGGAFVSGDSSLYDPKQMVEEGNVIVVTVNYRLGMLGYMASPELSSTASDRVSGNYGLLDQEFALNWVRQNIGAFGGNAGNVTIFGESAGGFSVCALMFAPSAAGLFRQAITESGPCAFPLPALASSEKTGTTFTESAGCKQSSAADTLACLRRLSTADVLKLQPSAAALLSNPSGLTTFFPNVDGKLIPLQPETALLLGQYNKVPVLEGTNQDEGALFIALAYDLLDGTPLTAADYPKQIAATAQALATQLSTSGMASSSTADSMTQAILKEYPLTNYTSPDQALATVIGDGTFSCTALITDQLFSLNVPTFGYEFADRSTPTPLIKPASFPYGATHTDELLFLFTQDAATSALLSSDENKLGASMRDYWTQFAQSGNPNALFPRQPLWPSVSILAANVESLVAPTPVTQTDLSTQHHCSFWQNLLLQGAL